MKTFGQFCESRKAESNYELLAEYATSSEESFGMFVEGMTSIFEQMMLEADNPETISLIIEAEEIWKEGVMDTVRNKAGEYWDKFKQNPVRNTALGLAGAAAAGGAATPLMGMGAYYGGKKAYQGIKNWWQNKQGQPAAGEQPQAAAGEQPQAQPATGEQPQAQQAAPQQAAQQQADSPYQPTDILNKDSQYGQELRGTMQKVGGLLDQIPSSGGKYGQQFMAGVEQLLAKIGQQHSALQPQTQVVSPTTSAAYPTQSFGD